MLKIGVIGFTGKINKIVIEEIAKCKDCTISGIFVRDKKAYQHTVTLFDDIEELALASDAIVDFSNPDLIVNLASKLTKTKIILVSGTTGFSDEQFQKLKDYSQYFPIISSPNMSIGINLLQLLLKFTAQRLGNNFDSAIIETHRKDKKDSPSGTAIMLAKAIEENTTKETSISSLRMGDILGEHKVIFNNHGEELSFSHRVFNRNIFALGAIRACQWGQNKAPGLYSMQDVLKDDF